MGDKGPLMTGLSLLRQGGPSSQVVELPGLVKRRV